MAFRSFIRLLYSLDSLYIAAIWLYSWMAKAPAEPLSDLGDSERPHLLGQPAGGGPGERLQLEPGRKEAVAKGCGRFQVFPELARVLKSAQQVLQRHSSLPIQDGPKASRILGGVGLLMCS